MFTVILYGSEGGHRAGAGPNNRPGRDPIYQRDPEIGSDAFTPMNQRRRGIHGEIIEPVTLMQEPTYCTSSEGSGGACFDAGPGSIAWSVRAAPRAGHFSNRGGDKEGGVPYPPETGILRRVLESDASHNPPVPDDNGVYCGSIRTSSL